MTRAPAALASFPAATCSAAPAAAADPPEGLLLPGEKVESVLAPQGERRTIAVAGVEGSVLSLLARETKGSHVRPSRIVTDPTGNDVPLEGGYVASRGTARLRRLDVGATGVRVLPDGTPDAAGSRLVAENEAGLIWQPVIAYQGAGRFVLAWRGATDDDAAIAIRNVAFDGAGGIVPTPYVAAAGGDWKFAGWPRRAVNPSDGSMGLGFSPIDGADVYRPAGPRLSPDTASAGTLRTLDDSGRLPEGAVTILVWNPARREFVVAMTMADDRVALRQLNPDGSIRGAAVLEAYGGLAGVLYSAPQPDTLGLARAFDGVADGYFGQPRTYLYLLVAPIR